jgi:hypothetical protein
LTGARGGRVLSSLGALALMLAGCGGGNDDRGGSKPPPSVARLRACLDRDPFFRDVRELAPGNAGRTVLSARERARVTDAVRGSTAALIARAGGPQQVGGTISEAPVRVFELYFFGDAKSVQRRGGQLQAAVGKGALDGARAYGPWVIVHYSFGIGDRAGNVGLGEQEAKPVTDCLREVGYL